ncbi:anti-phage deoxyguanosine triphosphatase [Colwellia polaris]|jgi:dGTPase|uniref:anti-phage deoxyguanosine triphosphatase n=1 Tax=Colwellia polaris TaxID=326537 RepID=UPI000A1766E0|nr:anti-phage deoxyguanosine triphosphatase [Colwellia polaris]|tara:strand:+ start:16573 stop:17919 length:1347 start_codon:yes stop_codon:yes gene_type:complete
MENPWLERRLERVAKRHQDHRSPFQRDRARILHSAAFRRLQSKTQVMGSGQSDFHRTRLTHSLEAAQIGSGIIAQIRSKYPEQSAAILPSDDSLIESLCLAHDIGHPPFGHGGEVALHYMMRDHGGFEGNGQTFRIVAHLEPFSEHFGMNLTRRTLLGLIKYPQIMGKLQQASSAKLPDSFRQLKADKWHPPKGLYLDDMDMINWVLSPLSQQDKALFQQFKTKDNHHSKTIYKSIDCSMMELADDIAYGIHDLEDAIVTGVVNQQDFNQHVIQKLLKVDDTWLQDYSKTLADNLFSNQRYIQKEAIGGLVNYLITAIELVDINKTKNVNFEEPLLRFNAVHPIIAAQTLQIFKDFVYQFVIKQTSIQQLEYRGQQIVMELFEALASDPERLLPKSTVKRWQQAQENNQNQHRVIADYVAGMTDEYATRLYQTLFLPIGQTGFGKHDY